MSSDNSGSPRSFRLCCITIGLVLLGAWVLAATLEVALVPTASMETTIVVGDHLLISKLFDGAELPGTGLRLPRLRQVRRGEVVSFRMPSREFVFLKRVVAIGGDVVEFRDGKFLVNGVPIEERYVCGTRLTSTMQPRLVPQGEVFVLGDNREHSEDSRDWGTVPVANILGRPVAVLWSYRAAPGEWLDASGHVRLSVYWTAARNAVRGTRWSRVARLL